MNLVISKKLKYDGDILSAFQKIMNLPGCLLLESGKIMTGFSRYSFMAADPFMTIISRNSKVEISRIDNKGSVEIIQGDLLQILRENMKKYKISDSESRVPFIGGAAGYFSYDLGRKFEEIEEISEDDLSTPECWLGFYDTVIAFDHLKDTLVIFSSGFPKETREERLHRAEDRIRFFESKLIENEMKSGVTDDNRELAEDGSFLDLSSNFDRESYCQMVDRVKEYITAGDIYQVNISQRFQTLCSADPWTVYKRLGKINPAPMAAYINCGDFQIVSASPERFIKKSDNNIETRPIKGTRPRGSDALEDLRQKESLRSSEKDRAELVMIVDLERNDFGKVCVPGSIKVSELYRLEEYSTVFHLVSTVSGELESEYDIFDLIRGAFPGGSISGAPKKRAMEIIEELEPVRRGIYCGSIGYISFDGNADFNIVIRTLLFKEDYIYFQVGGGITIDSDPQAEYQETLDKARALISSLRANKSQF
ncbi:MAG: aminodeoxychorismate synthase component I [Peptococcaceae bacterium]|nr:aminodeoxychorismate synthase component I [Peptococcaceae bacterium]